ncbi:capsid protein [Clostridium algidicarnis]|uniref:capsid protein n=1 Tax=Clostridium algidicarnis TaxID=37659 RepID=UPI001C0CB463|nr:capsid protein [Clostridium algidicarnis]MBU3226799.1 capsid protein [Clostridium algidicarnis]MBU3250290.1 capsid protein [Clostridium algidicarnis]
MAVYSYAEQFERELQQKYARELTSYALTQSNPGVKFINAQTIKLPRLTLSGYKDHNRNAMGFNTGTIANDWEPKKLAHDRDIEFALDPMDMDETNLVVEIANIQNVFETEQAIPEKDSYRYSKLYAEAKVYKAKGAVIDNIVLTVANVLEWFDTQMEKMDDEGVPSEGRILYVTPAINKLLKNASGLSRNIDVSNNNGIVDRRVYSLDDVNIIKVPSARFKTKYDFTNGCVPAVGAKQIHMILIHPSCVVSRDKYAYMKLFTPGTDSRTADKYVYQNRYYADTFLIENKACGIAINAEAEA